MSRRLLWTSAALSAASAAVLYAAPAQYLGRQQDDLLYIIGSQSLARGGYRLFTCIGSPPLVAVVPGLSILLLPVTWMFGPRYAAFHAFAALVLAGLPWLLWWWLKKTLGELEAVLIALIFATSPLVLCQAGATMSEAPYTALLLPFLAMLEAERWTAAGAMLAFLTQLRLAGCALMPAALLPSWRRKDWRGAAATLLPALLAGALWYLWSRWATRGQGEFHALELRLSYQAGVWSRLPAVALDNARYYLNEFGGCFLPLAWSRAAGLLGGALAVLALLGARRLWREPRAQPAILMLAGAAVLHAVWPWQYDRYLVPLLPWLLWMMAAGAGNRAPWLLGPLLALQLIFQSPRWLAGVEAWRTPELDRTYAWLRGHAGPGDGLSSAMNVRDGFYCALPSIPLPDSPDGPRFADALRRYRVRWVLRQDDLDVGLSLRQSAAVERWLQRTRACLDDRRSFRLAHEEPEEHARVYALR